MLENKQHVSSMIDASSYNKENGDLIVTFKGGSQYEFKMVTEQDYQLFSESESIGRGFNQHIKKYNGAKLITEQNQEDGKIN